MKPSDYAPEPDGKIGPNAVIQLREALIELEGGEAAQQVFSVANAGKFFETPPAEMVDQRIAAELFAALYSEFDRDRADRVATLAGYKTAAYVIANRIPGWVVRLLKILPAAVSAPVLTRAIEKNAWTFCGSGRFVVSIERSGAQKFDIHANPLRIPGARWHAAVFQELYRALVCRDTTVSGYAASYQRDHFQIYAGRFALEKVRGTCPRPQARLGCAACVSAGITTPV